MEIINHVTDTKNSHDAGGLKSCFVFIACLEKYKGMPVKQYYEVEKYACFNDAISCVPEIDSETHFPENALMYFLGNEGEWWIFNQNNHTCCAVNGNIISPSHKMRLNEGDCIQWGLSEWRIQTRKIDNAKTQNEIHNIAPAINPGCNPVKTEPMDLKWFSLTAETEQADNPFDLIMQNHHAYENTVTDADSDNVLNCLHSEYIDSMNTPGPEPEATSFTPQGTTTSPLSTQQNMPLTSLATETNTLKTLEDIVAGSMNIDQIFDGLDSLRETELFTPQATPEILHLFSPGNRSDSPVQQQPPELTQKEHHALSVDSHYQMGQSDDRSGGQS